MLRLMLALFVAGVLAGPAAADPGGRARPDRQSESRDPGAAVITVVERALIQDFFHGQTHSHAETSLPPGIRKKLARGKPLPPGIAKKLPDGLAARLAPRAGYQYRQVGADVLLVEAATGIIVDILRDAVR